MLEAMESSINGGFSQLQSCGDSSEEELSVLPRHTKVVVTGNNRTKSVLVGLQGVVKKAVGLGGWHWLVLTNGIEVKLQRNALSVIEAPTGHEDDDDLEFENIPWNGSDMAHLQSIPVRLFTKKEKKSVIEATQSHRPLQVTVTATGDFQFQIISITQKQCLPSSHKYTTMEKYFKRKTEIMDKSPIDTDSSNQRESSSKQRRVEFDLKNLVVDPGLRSDISDYHPNDQDKIRRAYIQKGPFQPRDHQFPQKQIGSKLRRFNPDWFDLHPSWLEYSIAQDAAFCLCCYLFKCEGRKQGGGDSFVKGGFTNWNKNERLQLHIGGPNSSHNEASNKCRDLLNQNQHIQAAFLKQSDKARNDYRVRLNASIDCIRFLLHQGLSFRGHDETENSSNQANLINIVGASCKRRDTLREIQAKKVREALEIGEIQSGKGLNQEIGLKRAGDTRWGSHYDMNCTYIARGRSRRHVEKNTNLHHYRVELFYSTIDMQIQELNNRFSERSNEVLLCVACLDPHDSFSTFDKDKLIQFAKFYPTEFSTTQLMALENQLETYILDMRSSIEFSNIKGIGGLAHKLVETKRDIVYHFVYLLVKLALILPVATASVERAFSAMKIVKNRLRSRMGDQWMNDCLVTYIEKDVFSEIDNEAIMQRFQNMKTRRCQL